MLKLFFFSSSGEKYNFPNTPAYSKIQIMVLKISVMSFIFTCNDEDNFKIVTIYLADCRKDKLIYEVTLLPPLKRTLSIKMM